MNSRLQELVDSGYSRDDVLRLASFTEEELNYAVSCAFNRMTRNCSKTSQPTVIYIGGQPGSGKSVMSMEIKNVLSDFVEIGIDNYRMYHPRYLEIEKYIRDFWVGKEESPNNTPGNDIANFTHLFAGAMTDKLAEMCSKVDEKGKSYSIIYEWGMREPVGPLKSMEELKKKGYKNIVMFLATPSNLSYDACNLRSEVMKNSKHILRKVPKSFHDLCVNTLPDSIDTIYKEGYNREMIDYMMIVSRDGKCLWDHSYSEKPGELYKSYLNSLNTNKINDAYKAEIGNQKEMIGLKDHKNELLGLKESLIFLSPTLFLDNHKGKSNII